MAKSNEQFSQEQKLAEGYRQKLQEREKLIQQQFQRAARFGSLTRQGLIPILTNALLADLSSGDYEKPSAFFARKASWVFGTIVHERFRDAFLAMADRMIEFPYSTSMFRRSYRSESYGTYANRIGNMILSFWRAGYIDADICDILTGNLPEEVLSYLRTRQARPAGFVPEVLAYELDKGDPRLERIVEEIICGEGSFSTVSRELIRGIVMSENERMHRLLCQLLLAARLQEGLRQVICEDADYGTKEAFLAILSTMEQHDLIRFSSVRRAVGTWLGLVSDEARNLDRISIKSLSLVLRCLTEPDFRAECLESEDAMGIHVALWSYAVDSVERAAEVLKKLCQEGSVHQVLCAGYFVGSLEDPRLRHTCAKAVLARHREHPDIVAVYLPSFLPNDISFALDLIHQRSEYDLREYFDSNAEALEFCDRLISLHDSLNQKELVFDPCIFPWHKAVLKKTDLIEKAIVLAATAKDQTRIDQLCPRIGECDAFRRDIYFKVLTLGAKTPAVRQAILKGLSDKAADTRKTACERCKGMTLTEEEYLVIEDTLRLRYDDARRYAMELLMGQNADALESSLRRLLSAPKAEKRTAALDMLTQLARQEENAPLVRRCVRLAAAIPRPTAQEKVLIDGLRPKEEATVEAPLFTEADRWMPTIEIDAFSWDCVHTFMEFFPDSRLEQQTLSGVFILPEDVRQEKTPCPAAVRAKELVKSLSDFFIAHEQDTFTTFQGEQHLLSCPLYLFHAPDPETGRPTIPRRELWQSWRDAQRASPRELLGALALAQALSPTVAYLARCGNFIDDLFGPGFAEPCKYQYANHIWRILDYLIGEAIPAGTRRHLAAAVGIWIARCVPDEMLFSLRAEDAVPNPTADQLRTDHLAGHFIVHPQINALFRWLEPEWNMHQEHLIPIALNVYERSLASGQNFFQATGSCRMLLNRSECLANTIYAMNHGNYSVPLFPGIRLYLRAAALGLIRERTLYYHLMQPDVLKDALELVTSVRAVADGLSQSASGRHSVYRSHALRSRYRSLIGDEGTPNEAQRQLIDLCRATADKLVPIVVEAELRRGDTPTAYSLMVSGIQLVTGAETFVRILSALGKDSLDRSVYYWRSSDTRRGTLSHLLAHCVPGETDSARTLGALLEGTDISEKRLIEAALYSPEWIDIIGQYLNLPGFKSACYYFMAHMNERFDEQKKAIIARFSPLSEEELYLGAFDVEWFRSAYHQLGEEKFNLVYDAAKYISDGGKHTRARKFADAALSRLSPEETENTIREKRNKDLLLAYAVIPLTGEDDLLRRYLYIQQFAKESRQFGAQRSASEKKAAETALRNLATNAGFSDTMRLTLRMETRMAQDSAPLFREQQTGEWSFRLAIDDRGQAEILCSKEGKPLKSIPAKAKKEPAVIRLVEAKKQFTEQYRRTRRMLEQAMEDGAVFRLKELAELRENPVVAPMLSALVFRSGEKPGLLTAGGLTDPDGTVLENRPEAELTVAHPWHLYSSGQWPRFQKWIFENSIVQPFRQVFRELYVKTRDELGTCRSLRYAGNQIQPRKAAAALKERRWIADVESGLQKVFYKENIVATIFALADWFTPADIEAPTLEYVAFFHRQTGSELKIDDIPQVIFSEVMRDVDLAVSVAHAGAVDPEASHSTVEMRRAILEFALPLLRLENVEIRENHAIIHGSLARYSVHLGSGVVHQIGGPMLRVLPVHSQHRGRIFLPFADDDPKTAEIISKIILFSEDRKLKDPGILSQISR